MSIMQFKAKYPHIILWCLNERNWPITLLDLRLLALKNVEVYDKTYDFASLHMAS